MEGNNNAPFCIGQKVVAKYTASNKLGQKISKGTEYTVLGLRYTNCCGWYVDVGLSSPTEFEGRKVVFACACEKTAAPGSGIAWAMAGMFAPIDKRTHEISIDKEVLDSLPKETEERSDVVPQTVNN